MRRGAVLLIVCLVTFAAGLGRSAIQDADEAYYAEAGREMVAGGDWITPHYNFDPRLQKPILSYWLIAASYLAFGVREAAARAPSALCGIGLAMVASLAGRRIAGPAVGLLAGLIVATSLGVAPLARQALPDVTLALWVSLAIFAATEAVADRAGDGPRRWRRSTLLYVTSAAAALGMLTKGPVAVALPLTVVVPFWIWERVRRGAAFPLTLREIVTAAAIFAAIAAPWYIAVTRAQGWTYLHDFFIGENVERFATAQNNRWRGWTYLPVIAGGLLPWSIFGALWVLPVFQWLRGRFRASAESRRLVCWTLGPLVFFMISVGSQPRYILPCLVPLSILLARTISSGLATRAPGRRGFTAAALLCGAVVIALGGLLARAHPLLAAVSPHATMTGPVVVMAAGLGVILSAVVARQLLPGAIAAAGALSLVVYTGSVLAPGRPEPVEIIARAVREGGAVSAVCACGAFARNLNFYTHVRTEIANASDTEGEEAVRGFLDSSDRVMAVINAPLLDTIEAHAHRRYPRLAEALYLNSGVWPVALANPDPRLVQHVVLVANR